VEELQSLLDECRRKNARAGITGILLYQEKIVLPGIEGDRKVVETLYETISEINVISESQKSLLNRIENVHLQIGPWVMRNSSRVSLRRSPGSTISSPEANPI